MLKELDNEVSGAGGVLLCCRCVQELEEKCEASRTITMPIPKVNWV